MRPKSLKTKTLCGQMAPTYLNEGNTRSRPPLAELRRLLHALDRMCNAEYTSPSPTAAVCLGAAAAAAAVVPPPPPSPVPSRLRRGRKRDAGDSSFSLCSTGRPRDLRTFQGDRMQINVPIKRKLFFRLILRFIINGLSNFLIENF